MNLKDTYNRIAEDWYRDHHQDDWWVEGTDKFISFLKPGDRVLDVGCGAGVKSDYLIQKGLDVIGIDFSEKMIGLAQKNVPEGKFQVLDLYQLDALREVFDGDFAQAVLLHVPKEKITAVMKLLVEKIKPNGYLYIAVKEKRPGEPDGKTVTENDYGYSYERFFSYYTKEEIEKQFKDLKLQVCYLTTKNPGKRNWIQIIGRKP